MAKNRNRLQPQRNPGADKAAREGITKLRGALARKAIRESIRPRTRTTQRNP